MSASAQVPRINTLFPIGAKAGTSVEVELRGASLDGAEGILVNAPGITGEIAPGGAKADEKFRPLWQSKCGSCHELRSPANRSMSPAQWAATVDRMVKVRNAPISPSEQQQISEYLQAGARAGKVTAKLTVAPNTPPGVFEVRAVTTHGVSTAAYFEVGKLPEYTAVNSKRDGAMAVKLPCVVNGCLAANAERHYLKLTAEKGKRYVFDLKGFRYKEASQMFFNPNLRLYDAAGTEIVENHGFHELDPLIDWTCPADGNYVLEVRDLLGRGNPGSVYRLTMSEVAPQLTLDASQDGLVELAPRQADVYVRPDNIILPPGGSTAVEVVFNRRSRREGDVELKAEGLPAGVIAPTIRVPQDRRTALLVITAAPDCKPLTAPIKVVETGKGDAHVEAIPQEMYRLNNDPRYISRTQCIVSVAGQQEYTLQLANPGPIIVHPRKAVSVPVKIVRKNGFAGPVTVRITGLPLGWVCYPETAGAKNDTITVQVRPDGNNTQPFMTRPAASAPYTAVLEGGPDDLRFAFATVECVPTKEKIVDTDR